MILLLVTLPPIAGLAALLAWAMGGSVWQIVGGGLGALILVQVVYVGQLFLRCRARRDDPADERRERIDRSARWNQRVE